MRTCDNIVSREYDYKIMSINEFLLSTNTSVQYLKSLGNNLYNIFNHILDTVMNYYNIKLLYLYSDNNTSHELNDIIFRYCGILIDSVEEYPYDIWVDDNMIIIKRNDN